MSFAMLVVLNLISIESIFPQSNQEFNLTTDSDTAYWFKKHLKDLQVLHYILPEENLEFFRINSPYYFLEISEKKKGRISLYVEEIWNSERTGEIYIKTFPLDSTQVHSIIKLIDSLYILDIPSDKYIPNWGQGLDGIIYVMENKQGANYSFKHFWTPSAQDSFPESNKIQFFLSQLDQIINYNKTRMLFEKQMPFYSWSYKGSMFCTGTNPNTKEYRKYKRSKEKQSKSK